MSGSEPGLERVRCRESGGSGGKENVVKCAEGGERRAGKIVAPDGVFSMDDMICLIQIKK